MDNGNQQPSEAQSVSRPWTVLLGTVRGIPIRVHFTFLLLLAWIGFTGSGGLWQIVYVLAVFGCVVLHELGHSIVAQAFGVGVSDIVLYPIGGVASLTSQPKPKQEFWIALAGPAVNILIAAGLFGWLTASGGLIPWDQLRMGGRNLLQELLAANLLLALFNMIPAFPMDGGRVLRALLSIWKGEAYGTRVAAAIGQLAAFGLALLGLMSGNVILLFIAFLVFVSAGHEAAQQQQVELAGGASVAEAMLTDVRTLPSGATLKQAADLLLDTSQQDFPVVVGTEVAGILTRQGLLRGLAEAGPSAYVTEAMSRTYPAWAPDTDLMTALREMQGAGSTCGIVLRDGQLAGMLTAENAAEFFVLQQVLGRRSRP
jgi:Zn-dependent protease